MLIDEFENTRMWAAEAERQQREREQARQVRERSRWLQSAARRVRDGRAGSGATVRNETGAAAPEAGGVVDSAGAAVDSAGAADSVRATIASAAAEAPTSQQGVSAPQERELAHAAR